MAVVGCFAPAPSAPVTTAEASGASTFATPSGLPAIGDIPRYRPGTGGTAVHPGPGPERPPVLAWEANVSAVLSAFPIVTDGRVLIATEEGEVRAFDARTGTARWTGPFAADGAILDTLTAIDGLVYFTTATTLYAISAADGRLEWSERLSAAGTRALGVSDAIYVGTEDGAVLGWNTRDRSPVFSWADPAGRRARVELVEPERLYVSLDGAHLVAIDVATGAVRWPFDAAASGVNVVGVGDRVYVSNIEGNVPDASAGVAALDRDTGRQLWRYSALGGRQAVVGAVEGEVLYLSSLEGGLIAIRDEGDDWSPLWQADAAPDSYWPPVRAAGLTFVAGADGSVAALRDATVLWQTEARPGEIQGPLVTGGLVIETAPGPGIVRAWAEDSLVAALPRERSTFAPAEPPLPDNPFSLSPLTSWSDLEVEVPLGLDVAPDGTIFVLSAEGIITMVDPKGDVVGRWGEHGSGPGQLDMTNAVDQRVGDLVVDLEGRVHVTDVGNHRVQLFTREGRFLGLRGSFGSGDGKFSRPVQLAVDEDGALYVSDVDNFDLQKFDREGAFQWRIGGTAAGEGVPEAAELHGVLVREDGTLLVFSGGGVPVLIVSAADGRVLGTWGTPGDEPGEISAYGEPTADDRGNVYVFQHGPAEAVQVFAPDGTLLGGVYHEPGGPFTERPPWSRVFWPAPVFGSDGVAYTFSGEGLMRLRIDLP